METAAVAVVVTVVVSMFVVSIALTKRQTKMRKLRPGGQSHPLVFLPGNMCDKY